MSNLRLINETSVTGGTTTLSVTDVFSSDFDIYKITLEGFYANTIDRIYLRLINSSGSVISASNYDTAFLEMMSSSSWNDRKSVNYDSMIEAYSYIPNTEAENYNAVFYLFNPASSSSYSFSLWQSAKFEYSEVTCNKGIGVLKQTASMVGFQFYTGILGGTFSGGKVRTYGLRVDS